MWGFYGHFGLVAGQLLMVIVRWVDSQVPCPVARPMSLHLSIIHRCIPVGLRIGLYRFPNCKDKTLNSFQLINQLNPLSGYWYMHCHMEAHQLEGMTMIIKEGLHSAEKKPPKNIPACGDFTWTMEEYEQIVNGPVASLGAVPQTDGKNIFSLKENVFVSK